MIKLNYVLLVKKIKKKLYLTFSEIGANYSLLLKIKVYFCEINYILERNLVIGKVFS